MEQGEREGHRAMRDVGGRRPRRSSPLLATMLLLSACASGPRQLEAGDAYLELGDYYNTLTGGAAYWRIPNDSGRPTLYQLEVTDSSRTRGLIVRSIRPFEPDTVRVGIGAPGQVDSLPWAEYEAIQGGTHFWSDSGTLRITVYKGWRAVRLQLYLSPRDPTAQSAEIEMHGQIATF